MTNRHTFTTFKAKLKDMNTEEKKELLKKLHADLMYGYTKRFERNDSMNCGNLKKKIAIVKTSLNMKGFNYYPRGG